MRKIFAGLSFFLVVLSAFAGEKIINIEPGFNLAKSARFYEVGSEGHQTLRGEILLAGGKNIQLPDACEYEGGAAQLYDAYTMSADKIFFVFTCKWAVMHPRINLKGSDFISYVYSSDEVNKLTNNKELSSSVSGYEGSLEEGGSDFYWYSTRELASRKLKETVGGTKWDSLELSHEIVLARLKDKDYEALKAYLTKERLEKLLKNYPLSKANSGIYNDFGFALGESRSDEAAYGVLARVEMISPERVVLKLNIADVLWASDKDKSKKYYLDYIEAMKSKNKESLVPVRVLERVGQK
ncbi:hypothetical protein BK666_29330 [Pseudomonas frederiksbergensis]|uniref:Uncharacterized protein n=1 Tax=Pseudomonas frederiksbergensis TaxID=104087 RepID=A0A423JMJ8_9PSED|nr:hypothetical protein [Pseudomonas frederiksbergensis]RON38907.1 hypothetical protein BK666_29330 [Pseudomonas frederiksbergensis]